MANRELYEEFHSGTIALKAVPKKSDFSMRNHLQIYDKYLKSGINLLDIGCGGGAFSIYAASKGAKTKGVDLSERAIAENRKSVAYLKLSNLTFECEDFMQYTDSDCYDVIMMTEVLEHLPDDAAALKKVNSLLKPGGHLLMSVPSINAPLHKKYVKQYGKDPFDERVGHLRRYDAETILSMVGSSGFEVLQHRLCEGYLRNWLFNDDLGQRLMRFNRYFVQDIVSFLDDTIFTPIWGESDIILAAKKK
jgi:2-polyprenyl-3-methyl-5-hydroxy-6-metoxy-1,4-benzoquinol methylase